MRAGIFVWQYDKDYVNWINGGWRALPGIPADDGLMPMSFAFVKTNDGLAMQGRFDSFDGAIRELADVARVRDLYAAQGIGFVPWGVIRGGGQAAAEGVLAGQIAAQCGGVYMVDLEPYPGFWTGGDAEVDAFMVAALNNGAREIWLTPDTRTGALAGIALTRWLAYEQVTRVWPQGYWTDFETGWARGLHQSLDPLTNLGVPRSKVWPVLPANAFTGDALDAIDWLEGEGYPGIAIWRRGTLSSATVEALNARAEYAGSIPAPTPPPALTEADVEAARQGGYAAGRADMKALAVSAVNAL